MATGILIAESLRDDASLQVVSWKLTQIERVTATSLTEERRAADLPSAWTVLHFELDDASAKAIAHALADALMRPGWCAEFKTEDETFTVFAGRMFRYRRDDETARAEATPTGPHIPKEQLLA